MQKGRVNRMSSNSQRRGSAHPTRTPDSLSGLPPLLPMLTFGPVEGMRARPKQPRCIVIAGPNGAGKTTFAREFLPRYAGVIHFVNADLIAGGLSPLKPELAALASGRLFLAEVDRRANAREDFAFETTLSGYAHVRRIKGWKASGYRVGIVFLQLASPQLALKRIAARVRQGGHGVPAADVVRRFSRGWKNFCSVYRDLADEWAVYDNSEERPKLVEKS